MDPWLNTILSFTSGVAVALVGALGAIFVQRRNDRRRRIDETRFGVYSKLMELRGFYFFVSSAEVRGEQVSPEIRSRIRSLAGAIADMLRYVDELREVSEILSVLMSMNYPSASERYSHIGRLLNSLGETVNPQYLKAAREIGNGNARVMAEGGSGRAYAPVFMD